MKVGKSYRHSLAGQLLVAMPNMGDRRFERTVIYMCLHSHDGAMGIVVNKPNESMSFAELLAQLNIEADRAIQTTRIFTGGPVDVSKGFVLHSDEFDDDGTIKLRGGLALTTTVSILKALATGTGPRNALLALGYAGWGEGQLEREVTENTWLTVDCDSSLVFAENPDVVWERAFAKIRANPWMVSGVAGHA
jgi:putative transcriptional regulator